MANLKISELPVSSALTGDELFAVVQAGQTKQTTLNNIDNYVIPTNLTVVKDTTVDLDESTYDDTQLVKLSWSGGAGNMTLNLPLASSSTNRRIRFISNGNFASNTRVYLTPQGGDTLDGSTDYYEINKSYEGIKCWSDGIEWFIIQKKA
jgi:hypothetical protein